MRVRKRSFKIWIRNQYPQTKLSKGTSLEIWSGNTPIIIKTTMLRKESFPQSQKYGRIKGMNSFWESIKLPQTNQIRMIVPHYQWSSSLYDHWSDVDHASNQSRGHMSVIVFLSWTCKHLQMQSPYTKARGKLLWVDRKIPIEDRA